MTNRKMEDDITGNTKKTCNIFRAAIATAITLSKTVKPMTLALFRRVGKGGRGRVVRGSRELKSKFHD